MTLLRLTPSRAGAQLEDALERLHAVYARDGVVMWREGTRAVKVGGEWIPQDSRPDFAGILPPNGRSVLFDAKSCQEPVYRHDTKTRAHQLIELWEAYEAGAVAGLLVCNLDAGRGWWLCPTAEWAVGQFVARHLVGARAIPAHPCFEGFFMPDWLAVTR